MALNASLNVTEAQDVKMNISSGRAGVGLAHQLGEFYVADFAGRLCRVRMPSSIQNELLACLELDIGSLANTRHLSAEAILGVRPPESILKHNISRLVGLPR